MTTMLTAQPTYVPFKETDEVIEEEPIPLIEHHDQPCPECWNINTVEDQRSGDIICSGCGLVKEEKSVSPDAEYRIFSNDEGKSVNRIRVGASYNPFLPHTYMGSQRKWERDEKEFLWEGMKNIDEIISRLLQDGDNKPVETRAKELFQKAFHWQFLQKQGVQSKVKQQSRPQPAIEKSKRLNRPRQKYSRRKQFVVACVWYAMKEHHINSWDIGDLSEMIDGREVSKTSVKHCLRDLNLR